VRKVNILIISEYIAPKQTIAAVRWTKVSKYLKKNHQVSIDVLTTKNIEWEEDKLLLQDCDSFTAYYEFDKDIILQYLTKFTERKKIKLKQEPAPTLIDPYTIVEEFEPDNLKHRIRVFLQECGMKRNAKKAFNAYKHNGKKYDVIISSYGPVWCHLAANEIKAYDSNVFWLADFRDIFAGNKYESKRDFIRHKQFVKHYLSSANVITKVAPDMDLYEGDKQNVVVLPNGFDQDEAVRPLPPEKFSFLYTGTMYEGETDLTPIFIAISELVNNHEIDLDDVVIEYAGRSSQMFNQQLKNSKLEVRKADYGLIPREKSIELQQKCAILMQASSYDTKFKPLWTGKMFEYMMIKKPIVYSLKTNVHTRIADEIHYIGGIAFESGFAETMENLKKYISSKYKEWKNSGDITIDQVKDYIDQFSYEHISEELWKIINR